MAIDPYEDYALFILIGGTIATLLLIFVILRERKIYQRTSHTPSRHTQSSYKPFAEEIIPYQPEEKTKEMQTSRTFGVTKFCSYCGEENSDRKKICKNCGQNI